MAKLEEIVQDACVKGIAGEDPVTVVATKWHGDSAIEVTYRTESGATGSIVLFREREEHLEVVNSLTWTFSADANELKLASEAYRISLAHLFDPYLAVRTSLIDPLPHQITAVYKDMLPLMPLRYVLADDPGAGKTIMTGLLIKEMIARGDLKRCLIVCPGNLVEQWQDELFGKFELKFNILTNDMLESAATGNAFSENNLCIARLDKLSRNEQVQEKLSNSTPWDLIVCDEAHKMSATVFGNEVKKTKRFKLGELLGKLTENLLLLTATPHNGKPEDFQLFMSLVDPDRFGTQHSSNYNEDVSDVMRRLVKEDLLKFDGRPLFPERIAYTVNYALSDAETSLYRNVTKYVTEEFNRAENLDKKQRNSVGFALTILQRRLASSPEAIYQSLKRRRERLEAKLEETKYLAQNAPSMTNSGLFFSEDIDEDDFTAEEYEGMEEDVVDTTTAAKTIPELEAEIYTLKTLEEEANNVRKSGVDKKWDELSKLLQDDAKMFSDDGRHEKLIIFTEHKDTLEYLSAKIRSLLGREEAVVTIRGGMSRDDRRRTEERFRQDKNVRILVATDAAGEGINLQRAHLMINYDLPWNPNRLEQRFGRIHRIGQTEVCHLWNLVSSETREGQVFERLLSKLDEERSALGGKVFDVLGKLTFEDKPLRDLLIEAVRYGDEPEVKAQLNQVVDNTLDTDSLQKLIEENALVADTMDVHDVMSVREEMERVEAAKLEPHFIEAFFVEAMKKLDGKLAPKEPGRYEIIDVPYSVYSKEAQIGSYKKILKSYERICFDKEFCDTQGQVQAEFIYPGHPLLDATVFAVLEQFLSTLKKGAILIDDTDMGSEPRFLFYVESSIQDGIALPDGTRRTIAKDVRFVEVDKSGQTLPAGYAPYLDYQAPKAEEADKVRQILADQDLLKCDIETMATDYAIEHIVSKLYEEVRARRLAQIDKVEKAVRNRLTSEINYWDSKAWELEEKERAGKFNDRLNAANARRRADDLNERLTRRMSELQQERNIMQAPPRIVGGAFVVPAGMLDRTENVAAAQNGINKQAIEQAGMQSVMAIERNLGNKPEDVSAEKCGYDIESKVPEKDCGEGPILRMIEVKGREAGSTTVTVSKNEILCALNNPLGFILAIVEVDGNKTRTVYLKEPFDRSPGFAEVSCNFEISKLMQAGTILLEEEEIWQ